MSRPDVHEHVAALMPWYLNATLPEPEKAEVEQHVHDCLTCYAMLQQERRLRGVVRAASGPQLSSERGFAALVSSIDERRGEARGVFGSRRTRGLAAAVGVAAAVAVAVVALTSLAGLGLFGAARPGDDAFGTLATQAGQAAPQRLDVVFAEGVSEAEMRVLLREIDGTIVSGPTRVGRYTLELEGELDEAQLAAVVERLEQDERLRFVGRSFNEENRE